jgi:hypothetical protein
MGRSRVVSEGRAPPGSYGAGTGLNRFQQTILDVEFADDALKFLAFECGIV